MENDQNWDWESLADVNFKLNDKDNVTLNLTRVVLYEEGHEMDNNKKKKKVFYNEKDIYGVSILPA